MRKSKQREHKVFTIVPPSSFTKKGDGKGCFGGCTRSERRLKRARKKRVRI